MAETATNTTNSFLRPELLETNTPIVPKIASTGQLTSSDILNKLQTNQPIYEGETLPDIPEGTSARQFYGKFPGGLAVYDKFPSSPTVQTPTYTGGIDFFDPTASSGKSDEKEAKPDSDIQNQMDQILDVSEDSESGDEDSFFSSDTTSTSVDTSNTKSSFSNPDLDINISLNNLDIPNLEEMLEEVEDIEVVNRLEQTLKNGFDNISNSVDKGIDSLVSEAQQVVTELETFANGPVDYISNSISNEIQALVDSFSSPDIAIGKVGDAVFQTVASQFVSTMFSLMGLGAAAGPLGMIATRIMMNPQTQMGRAFDEGSTTDGDNVISDYNTQGVAVNNMGQMGTINGMYAFKSFSSFMKNFGKSEDEIEKANLEKEENQNVADLEDVTSIDDGDYDAGLDFDVGTTAAEQEAAIAEGSTMDAGEDDGGSESTDDAEGMDDAAPEE